MKRKWNEDARFVNDYLKTRFQSAKCIPVSEIEVVASRQTVQLVFVGPHPTPTGKHWSKTSLNVFAEITGIPGFFDLPFVHLINLSDIAKRREHGRGTKATSLAKRKDVAWVIAANIENLHQAVGTKPYLFDGALLVMLGDEVAQAFRVFSDPRSRRPRWHKYSCYKCHRPDPPVFFTKFRHPSPTSQDGLRGYSVEDRIIVENMLKAVVASQVRRACPRNDAATC